MSVTAKCLVNAQYVPNADTLLYTATSVRTIIDKFTVTNTDSGSLTITIYLVPTGQSVGASYKVVSAFSISAGATQDFTSLQNHILNSGDTIYANASSASKMVARVSGREIS